MEQSDNGRKLEGTIVFASLGRLHYGFDVFLLHLPPTLSTPNFHNCTKLTDGKSINYNAHFVSPSDAKLLLHGKTLLQGHNHPTPLSTDDEELIVFVSERTGNARIHFTCGEEKPTVLGPLMATLKPSSQNDLPFFFDRPLVKNGMAYFISIQEPADLLLKSWTAVYATCLLTGKTTRLTPPGVADYSPSISPSGKWMMVASYGPKNWERDHVQELQTDLYVFKAEDGSARKMVAERGGWPSWADENTVYFHRRAEDGWWSIYKLTLPNSSDFEKLAQPERITPPSIHAFTPCASTTGNWIAVATRRKETKFRHIEIFDLNSRSFISVTSALSPQIHHYSPFVSPDSRKLGFHRFRGENSDSDSGADTVVPFLEPVQSPLPRLRLHRINGSFPAFSPDGSLIAFNPSLVPEESGINVVRTDGSKKWILFKGPAFAVAWSGKHKGLLYASVGPIFAPNQATVHIASIRFDSDQLGEGTEAIKSEVRCLTKEGTKNNAFAYSSPDGKQLVFRSGRSGHKNLFIMDAEQGEEGWIRTLTDGPWIDTMPCWSPDGQWIAFSSNRHDPQQEQYFSLYLIHSDGTGLYRVPGIDKERINHVCFSPDSKSLMFAANFSGVSAEPISIPNQYQPYGELYVSALDGSHVQRLTFNAYEDGTPAWHHTYTDLGSDLQSPSFRDKIIGDELKGEFDEPLWLTT